MSRKKKHPVKKMTEKDYRNYVMSLKDEKPVKINHIENAFNAEGK